MFTIGSGSVRGRRKVAVSLAAATALVGATIVGGVPVATAAPAPAPAVPALPAQKPAIIAMGLGPFSGTLSGYWIGAAGALYTTWQTSIGSSWQPSQRIGGAAPGGGLTDSPFVLYPRTGPFEPSLSAYGRAGDGRLYTTWQTAAGSLWQPWQSIGGAPPAGGILGSPAVVAQFGPPSGILSAFARAGDGALYTTWQTAAGSLWQSWQRIGGTPPPGGIQATPVVLETTGVLSAFARAGDGGLYTTWQSQPGSSWNDWQRIGGIPPTGGIQGSPALVTTSTGPGAGGLQAYARGADGGLYTTWQARLGSLWEAWQRIGGAPPTGGIQGSPAVVVANGGPYAGTASAYAFGADGMMYTTWQNLVGGLWAPWTPIGGKPPSGGLAIAPSAVESPSPAVAGTLSLYALGAGAVLYTMWQANPGSGWYGWQPIGG